MFCANCYKEIPIESAYFKHQNTNQCFCSLDCLNDYMIGCHAVTIETNNGKEQNYNK